MFDARNDKPEDSERRNILGVTMWVLVSADGLNFTERRMHHEVEDLLCEFR
jgi:hypothetical protein